MEYAKNEFFLHLQRTPEILQAIAHTKKKKAGREYDKNVRKETEWKILLNPKFRISANIQRKRRLKEEREEEE